MNLEVPYEGIESAYARDLLEYIQTSDAKPWDVISRSTTLLGTFLQANWIKNAAIYFVILLMLSALEGVFRKKAIISALQFIASVLCAISITSSVYTILSAAQTYMRDFSVVFGTWIPTFGTITASGGNVASATVNSALLSVFFSAMQFVMQTLLPYFSALFCGFAILDAIMGNGKIITLATCVKNFLFGALIFLTAIFCIILCFQNLAAVNTDSVFGRTLRLVISRTIPIVGATVGEALRIVSGSMIQIKNTLGISSVLFLLGIFIPVFSSLFCNGYLLQFFSFLCDFFGIAEIKRLFTHLKYALDFTLATFSCIFMIAILNIGIFMRTAAMLTS